MLRRVPIACGQFIATGIGAELRYGPRPVVAFSACGRFPEMLGRVRAVRHDRLRLSDVDLQLSLAADTHPAVSRSATVPDLRDRAHARAYRFKSHTMMLSTMLISSDVASGI